MKIKGKYSESAVLYAILLSVAAVVSIVVFIVVLNVTGGSIPEVSLPDTRETEPEQTDELPAEDTGAGVSEEVKNEMYEAVNVLMVNNLDVLKLYYLNGLSYESEPYGNVPEDGYYTVSDDEYPQYTTLEQIEELVDSTYVPEVAQSVKQNTTVLNYGPVYITRSNGKLGRIADFRAVEYNISWSYPSFQIKPVSETDSMVTLGVHDSETGEEIELTAEIVKTDAGWRLTDVVF